MTSFRYPVSKFFMDEKGYHKLRLFHEAHAFVIEIYRATNKWPKDEIFGLTNQIRRSSVSVAANIVEGQARGSSREFLQFLKISNGSLAEVEYYLELSRDLGYISESIYSKLDERRLSVGKQLHALMRAVHNKIAIG